MVKDIENVTTHPPRKPLPDWISSSSSSPSSAEILIGGAVIALLHEWYGRQPDRERPEGAEFLLHPYTNPGGDLGHDLNGSI